MSDHPKEADRNLKRIYICDDIYLDVFYLLAPAKVGLELAIVSHRFDALVDTHFRSRKWTLGNLGICYNDVIKLKDDRTIETLSFPQKPLPSSVVGFANVYCVINSDTIAFIQCIGRLLESNICLELAYKLNLNDFAASIWPLLNATAIIKMSFGCPTIFQYFRRHISPSFLHDFFNLRMISFINILFLQFVPNDGEESSDGQELIKWLHRPRADGQPKMLTFDAGTDFPMDTFKKTFLNATTSVSFIISLLSFPSIGPFELVNSLTREHLTSRQSVNGGLWSWLIERCPVDKGTEQWAKWEREALDAGKNDWKMFGICF